MVDVSHILLMYRFSMFEVGAGMERIPGEAVGVAVSMSRRFHGSYIWNISCCGGVPKVLVTPTCHVWGDGCCCWCNMYIY